MKGQSALRNLLPDPERAAVLQDVWVRRSDLRRRRSRSWQPSELVARCTDHVVDYTQLDADLASGQVPDYVFITPNMTNDMHDGSVAQGDAWLAAQVPKILASSRFKQGGVLFLLWDEGSSQGDDPPVIVVSPNAKAGFVSQTDYDTSAFLRTQEAILGLEALPCNATPDAVPMMADLFTVPMGG